MVHYLRKKRILGNNNQEKKSNILVVIFSCLVLGAGIGIGFFIVAFFKPNVSVKISEPLIADSGVTSTITITGKNGANLNSIRIETDQEIELST
jgi:hypothetical protein